MKYGLIIFAMLLPVVSSAATYECGNQDSRKIEIRDEAGQYGDWRNLDKVFIDGQETVLLEKNYHSATDLEYVVRDGDPYVSEWSLHILAPVPGRDGYSGIIIAKVGQRTYSRGVPCTVK